MHSVLFDTFLDRKLIQTQENDLQIIAQTVLPASASDVYYRDDIGNISTSALRQLDDAVELDLRPR